MITVCVRFDCVKYNGVHEAGDDSDDDGDHRATYSLGIAMLVFLPLAPARARDFATSASWGR